MESQPLKDTDICPYCGEEVEDGYLVGWHVLFWTDRKPKYGVVRNRGNIKLNSSFWGIAKVRAKLCDNCELIIYRHSER